MTEHSVIIGQSNNKDYEAIPLSLGNRHGLIAGATGTGKTVTLQRIAEGFANAGVPCFVADIKGDLSGLAAPSLKQDWVINRATEVGIEHKPEAMPVQFWDLYGEYGTPIRATVSDMGPLLLSRLMELNETQEGVLNIAFKLADDEGLMLLDIKDLRAMLNEVSARADELQLLYGNISAASVGSILRRLLVLEQQGADQFFGETALDLMHMIQSGGAGKGMINILDARTLYQSPRLYASFLMWLLSELFEELPEVGDLDKPKSVFFFDEAHLLFEDAPKSLVDKVEQLVRLIRSKGVGVYFITQNPADIPDGVNAQIGHRVQHALRAFTPKAQKEIKAVGDSFRPNPDFDTVTAVTELGIGEALVSTLDKKGVPSVVQITRVVPPNSQVGALGQEIRVEMQSKSQMEKLYRETVDRVSAYEILQKKLEKKSSSVEAQAQKDPEIAREVEDYKEPARKVKKSAGRQKDTMVETIAKSAMRSASSAVGRAIVRGILGSLRR